MNNIVSNGVILSLILSVNFTVSKLVTCSLAKVRLRMKNHVSIRIKTNAFPYNKIIFIFYKLSSLIKDHININLGGI